MTPDPSSTSLTPDPSSTSLTPDPRSRPPTLTACAPRLCRSENQIGDDGAKALAGALPGLTALKFLNLR